jgi:hypothetical protein
VNVPLDPLPGPEEWLVWIDEEHRATGAGSAPE